MPVYYMLHDADRFQEEIRQAFADSWRRKSFEPCRKLCNALMPTVVVFADCYHIGAGEPLIRLVARGLNFSSLYWRTLVGEVLLYAAADVPEIQVAPETLCCVLTPEQYLEGWVQRGRFAPIQQAHYGSRDLVFGGGFYRPDHAGYNDRDDVARLTRYLQAIDPESWTAIELVLLRDVEDDAERADELEFARERFLALRQLYERAEEQKWVVVCEIL